jgi:hypothetical protein
MSVLVRPLAVAMIALATIALFPASAQLAPENAAEVPFLGNGAKDNPETPPPGSSSPINQIPLNAATLTQHLQTFSGTAAIDTKIAVCKMDSSAETTNVGQGQATVFGTMLIMNGGDRPCGELGEQVKVPSSLLETVR